MDGKKNLSEAARAAKEIRKILKENFPGVKFSVRSDNYSMGNSVQVEWVDGPTEKQVNELVGHYEYGSFDGMQDLYVIDNKREDIPQTKYLQEQRNLSQKTWGALMEQVEQIHGLDEVDKRHRIFRKFNELDLYNFDVIDYIIDEESQELAHWNDDKRYRMYVYSDDGSKMYAVMDDNTSEVMGNTPYRKIAYELAERKNKEVETAKQTKLKSRVYCALVKEIDVHKGQSNVFYLEFNSAKHMKRYIDSKTEENENNRKDGYLFRILWQSIPNNILEGCVQRERDVENIESGVVA